MAPFSLLFFPLSSPEVRFLFILPHFLFVIALFRLCLSLPPSLLPSLFFLTVFPGSCETKQKTLVSSSIGFHIFSFLPVLFPSRSFVEYVYYRPSLFSLWYQRRVQCSRFCSFFFPPIAPACVFSLFPSFVSLLPSSVFTTSPLLPSFCCVAVLSTL